jgi:predicted methyltransferase
MKSLFAAVLASACLAASLAQSAPAPAYVTKALADPARPADQRTADAVRAPAETLAFAGVKPGMTVVELFPGGGYFTRPLSDIVGPGGHVLAVENAGWKGAVKADQAMLADKALANVTLSVQPFGALPTDTPPADLFWITQNYHDLKIAEYGQVDMAEFNRKVFAMLKPGGVYFILDHDAAPGLTEAQIAKLHRIDKATVVREVEAAGFKLADEGGFLRRPGDDHTLPIFDKAIQGRTDQYALKFVKPKS